MDPKQYKLHLELLEKLERKQNKTLSESDMKLIDEIDKTHGTGKYRNENKNILSRLSNDTKSWILSVTGIITVVVLIYLLIHYVIALYVLLTICSLVMVGVLAYSIKELIKMMVFNDYGE